MAWNDSQPLIKQHFPEIRWTMNPPRTPSFGGHFESLIRTVKTMFRELVKGAKYSLTDDELNTSLKEAAAIANMRPLTELSDDPQDSPPLKPSDFLNAPVLGSTPDWSNANSQQTRQDRSGKISTRTLATNEERSLKELHKAEVKQTRTTLS